MYFKTLYIQLKSLGYGLAINDDNLWSNKIITTVSEGGHELEDYK